MVRTNVCLGMCARPCVCVDTIVYVSVRVFILMLLYMCVRSRVFMLILLYTCVHVYMRDDMCVCVCECVFVYMFAIACTNLLMCGCRRMPI